MSSLIQDILREIDALSQEEQLALDEQLATRLARHWQREVDIARDEAQRRGIDQSTIDQAVDRQRYGQ